jgi:hypothetical protein
MRRLFFSVLLVIVIVSCMAATVLADDSIRGIDPETGRWDSQARTFNPLNTVIIYDTTNRSNITNIIIQDWAIASAEELIKEIEDSNK